MVFKRRIEKWEVIEEWRKEEKWEWRGTAAQSGEESRYVSFFFSFFLLPFLLLSFLLCIFTLVVFVTSYDSHYSHHRERITSSMALTCLLFHSIYGHVTLQMDELLRCFYIC